MKDYWFPWTPSHFKADTMHLSALQDGIYRRLIDHYMETKLGLPDNDQALARIAGVDLDTFVDNSGDIRAFFKADKNGRLSHKKCDSILKDQNKRSKINSKNGKKGGKKSSRKIIKNQDDNENSQAVAKQTESGRSEKSKHMTGHDMTGQDKTPSPYQNQESRISSQSVDSGDSEILILRSDALCGYSVISYLSDEEIMSVKECASGMDIYQLARDFDDRVRRGQFERPKYPMKAFKGWIKNYINA